MTGLQNRRSTSELGRIKFSRAKRMKRPFSYMMLDLDHFKKINDQFGHQSGDQILQDFAARYLNAVRDGDLVGRYGGEEVIILLPETDQEMVVHDAAGALHCRSQGTKPSGGQRVGLISQI